ncbi:hypothetical protein [Ruminococcus albus]|uniref:hypothetical protein n=1 Tax=Ruminococcus albus TaxID=1264 RepID=UPI0004650EC0|nr:hypothetical protein [Ruminococcus albus]
MKINYNFRSNLLPIITLLLAFIPLVLGAGLTISLNNEVSSVLKPVVIIMYPVIVLACYILLKNLPVEIFADENALNIKVLFKKTVIRYSDIESIRLEHEFRKAKQRGEQNWYGEILKITDINKNEYVYYRKLDLDQDKIAMNPTYLPEQFENSEFAKLQTYIEERIPIMQID